MTNERMMIHLRCASAFAEASARQGERSLQDTAIVGQDTVVAGAAREDTRPTSDGFNAKLEICEKGRKNAKIRPD